MEAMSSRVRSSSARSCGMVQRAAIRLDRKFYERKPRSTSWTTPATPLANDPE